MATGEIDTEDAAVAAVFGLAAASQVGIADVSLFGYSMTDVLTQVSGQDVTVAMLISLGALGWVWVTNEPDLDKIERQYGSEYLYASYATVALPVAVEVIPSVSDLIQSNDIFALASVAIMAIGFTALSYLG